MAESASAVEFTVHDDDDERVTWHQAKSRCEALGQRLTVLDTEEKLMALKVQL